MKDVDRRLIDLAAQQHQVFSRAQAREAGLSASARCRRIERGQLIVCGPNALHLPGTVLTYHGHLMAGLLDLGPDALVSGRSAAALHGLDSFDEGPLEYLVPRAQRDRQTVGLVTSSASITPLDRVVVDGFPCTSGTRTVVELLGRVSEREAGNALDSACRKRLTAPCVVRRRLDELGRRGRAGVEMFEQIVKAGCVESWLERQFIRVIRRAGLPEPQRQRRYHLPGVGVARVDFEFAPHPLIVEVGGQRGYLSLDERRRQEQRRNALQVEGKVIYFFSREQVQHEPAYVVSTVAAALGLEAVGSDCQKRNPA